MPDDPKSDPQATKKHDQQPYQNPGKDKSHPGDEAAVDASTEPREGKPARR